MKVVRVTKLKYGPWVLIPIKQGFRDGGLLEVCPPSSCCTASHIRVQGLDSKNNCTVMLKHSDGVNVRKPMMSLSFVLSFPRVYHGDHKVRQAGKVMW